MDMFWGRMPIETQQKLVHEGIQLEKERNKEIQKVPT